MKNKVTGLVVIVAALTTCGFTMLQQRNVPWEYARYMVFYEDGGVVWQTPTTQVVHRSGYLVLAQLGVNVKPKVYRDQYDFLQYAGSQSWELIDTEVDVTSKPGYVVYLFKRKKAL